MRKAEVRMHDIPAGILTEDDHGYTFTYLPLYLSTPEFPAISLTLPKTDVPYTSNVLFPFFDGLIPEGWLLDIAQKNWKINLHDRMGLLMVCCLDCIGAVSIVPLIEE